MRQDIAPHIENGLMFKSGSELRPTCRLIRCYRKNNQNWIQIGLTHTARTQVLPAKLLLTKHADKLSYFSPKDIATIATLAQDKALPIIETLANPTAFKLYPLLLTLQTAILIASNLMSSKVMHLWGIDIVAGAICFPITYTITEIVAELFGFHAARKTILLSSVGNLTVMFFIHCSIIVPAASFWPHQTAYETVLNHSLRIFFASMVAFAIGDILNCFVLLKLRQQLSHRWLYLRLVVASLLGFLMDSFIFLVIAHAGELAQPALLNMLLNVLFHKLLYELLIAAGAFFLLKKLSHVRQNFAHQAVHSRFL